MPITREYRSDSVSRQAVSKWKKGQGYPEVEKLLLYSSTLNISLGAFMSVVTNRDAGKNSSPWYALCEFDRGVSNVWVSNTAKRQVGGWGICSLAILVIL